MTDVFLRDGKLTINNNQSGWFDIEFELNGQIWNGQNKQQRIEYEHFGNGVIVHRFIRGPLTIDSVSDRCRAALKDQHPYTLRWMHSSNVRTEKYPVSRPEYPLIRPLPNEPVCFNDGEANHFPAFTVFDAAYQTMLVEGDLNQTQFRRVWEVGQMLQIYRGIQRYESAASKPVLASGEELEVSRVYYEILHNTHPQDAYNGYIKALQKFHSFAVVHSPMRHGAVFCTWNYGTRHHISESLLLTRAKALAQRIPECTHFLIDDGYQANRNCRFAGLDAFYPEPSEGYNRNLFPSGMHFMASELKKLGLTPAIWLAPALYLDSRLATEHPEWLLRDEHGNTALLGNFTYLDVSVPEAYEFFIKVLDVLFVEWGFRGLKFDFMTQWFQLENARFRHGSGDEWRDRIFGEIRQRIGRNGIFMTCIAMSMGNPFPGRFADCYRCGCDIHDGTREEQLKACRATLPQILLPGKELFLLNMDSMGFGDTPLHEQLVRLNWVFITQGIFELGGKIESMPDSQIAMWRKLLKNIDRGQRVRCLDEAAFTGADLPAVLRSGHFTAFFNWSETQSRIFKLDNYFPSEVLLRDFWQEKELSGNTIELSPFSSILLESVHTIESIIIANKINP